MIRGTLILLLAFWPGLVTALELVLPSDARETLTRNSELAQFFVPMNVFAHETVPGIDLEGEVRRSAFRIAGTGLTPLQILQPLRDQLQQQGFDIVLDCTAIECGGFDFRFAIETLPAPAMTIGLRDFHHLTAIQGPPDGPSRAVTLLASVSSGAAHLQIMQAGQLGDAPDQFRRTTADAPTERETTPLAETPLADLPAERIILEGLDFGAGADRLGTGPFDALAALVETLRAEPDLRVALVGHTDSTGSLEVNQTISRRRADAVRARLIEAYDIAPTRVEAHGVGYLSPIASNATEAGRRTNRRVEAIFLGR